MKILALESSACAASAAITEDGKLLGEAFLNTGLTHSQTLLPLVQGLFKNANLALEEIDAFAVTNGPGSFTGVRIGVAALKGLAFPYEKPCIPLSTLEVIAFGQTGGDCTVCAAMDARCMQVYTALFSCHAGTLERLTEDSAMKIAELPPLLAGKDLPIVLREMAQSSAWMQSGIKSPAAAWHPLINAINGRPALRCWRRKNCAVAKESPRTHLPPSTCACRRRSVN